MFPNFNILSEQYCHLLLSGGLNLIECPAKNWRVYIVWLEYCLPTRYAGQRLWLADDLTASIAARTDTEHEPDNGKLVLSVGVIDIHCTINFLPVDCHLIFVSGARCHYEAWSYMYNNTSTAPLLGIRAAS